MSDVCKHGGLERKCDICRLELKLAEKDVELAEAKADVENLTTWIYNGGCHPAMCPAISGCDRSRCYEKCSQWIIKAMKPIGNYRTCLSCGRKTCDRQPEDHDPAACKDWKPNSKARKTGRAGGER